MVNEKYTYFGLFQNWGTNTWRSKLVAIALTLELAWVLLAIAFLFTLRASGALGVLDASIFLVLVHTATSLTLVWMAKKVETKQLSEIHSWWLIIGLVVEIILIWGAATDFSAIDARDRNILISFSAIALGLSTFEIILYFLIWAMGPATGSSASKDVMEAAAPNVPGGAAISFSNGTANLRYQLPNNARIVHAIRKDL